MILLAAALVLSLPSFAASLPDPTALPRSMAAPGAENAPAVPVLEWVRVNGHGSIAWYGGTTVKVGDAIEGGRVAAIHEDHIVISSKSGRRSVYLLERSIRTEPLKRPRTVR
jgi:hypothetical protein